MFCKPHRGIRTDNLYDADKFFIILAIIMLYRWAICDIVSW